MLIVPKFWTLDLQLKSLTIKLNLYARMSSPTRIIIELNNSLLEFPIELMISSSSNYSLLKQLSKSTWVWFISFSDFSFDFMFLLYYPIFYIQGRRAISFYAIILENFPIFIVLNNNFDFTLRSEVVRINFIFANWFSH